MRVVVFAVVTCISVFCIEGVSAGNEPKCTNAINGVGQIYPGSPCCINNFGERKCTDRKLENDVRYLQLDQEKSKRWIDSIHVIDSLYKYSAAKKDSITEHRALIEDSLKLINETGFLKERNSFKKKYIKVGSTKILVKLRDSLQIASDSIGSKKQIFMDYINAKELASSDSKEADSLFEIIHELEKVEAITSEQAAILDTLIRMAVLKGKYSASMAKVYKTSIHLTRPSFEG